MTAPAVPDMLGPEYEAITLPMGEDEEGEVVATRSQVVASVLRGRLRIQFCWGLLLPLHWP